MVLALAWCAQGAEHPGPTHPGAVIYKKLCVECHAENGAAVKGKTDEPLTGSRDVATLAKRIERTMPEDHPELCVGEDAKAVAQYIYDAFYSVEARARNTPSRIDLTRLTVSQYQNSVADLIVSFRGTVGFGNERGLKANYYGGFNFNERKEFQDKQKAEQEARKKQGGNPEASPPPLKKDRYERIDRQVGFDFGDGVPKDKEAAEFSSAGFSIRWEGSLIAEETGTYEFVVRTRNGITLWVNQANYGEEGRKTIDGWVAPGNEIREEKGSVFLIGGRPYPLRLEFFKHKEKASLVELLWKKPGGVLETIPERNLVPYSVHETCVISTPFPADDRSVGYERGSNVSKAWIEAVTTGAIDASDYVLNRLDLLARTKPNQPDRAKKIGEFGVQFVERAFRHPLSEAERKRFVDHYFDSSESLDAAVKKLVLMTLTSPRFLYPGLPHGEKTDQWELASRLALTLWDSLPDGPLRDRAQKGQLAKPEQLAKEVDRMVWDFRTRAKMRGFFRHWLELDRGDDLAKDKSVFPEFNDAVFADLRTSLDLFIEDAVWGEGGNYHRLMLADHLFLNERLGKLYGKPDLKGNFQKVSFSPDRRSGIVTHPFLLTTLAYHNSTSPIHRGVFLTRNIAGIALKSPPMANVFKEGEFNPSLTMREKVTEMTRSKACMACHVTINPLGFSLEHYDGIGRWQVTDRKKPVDTTGNFKTESGETVKIKGARDVAEFAANSPDAHRAFIQQLFHHLVKQPVLAYGDDKMEDLRTGFEKSQYYIPELLKRIALSAVLETPEHSPQVSVAKQ